MEYLAFCGMIFSFKIKVQKTIKLYKNDQEIQQILKGFTLKFWNGTGWIIVRRRIKNTLKERRLI